MITRYQKPPLGRQLNRAHPLARRQLLCCPMFERSGLKTFDHSFRGYSGTFAGSASWQQGNIDFGASTSDLVDFGYPVIGTVLTGLTVEMWWKPKTASTQVLLENGTAFINNTFMITQETSELFAWLVYGASSGDSRKSHIIYSVGQWYHLVGVWTSGQRIKFYVNGIVQTGADDLHIAQGYLKNGNTQLQLGKRPGTTTAASDGACRLLRIWDRELTLSEIASLYINPYQMFEPSLPVWAMYSAPTGGVTVPQTLLAREHY